MPSGQPLQRLRSRFRALPVSSFARVPTLCSCDAFRKLTRCRARQGLRIPRPPLHQIEGAAFDFLKNHSYINSQDSRQKHRDTAADRNHHNQRTPARNQLCGISAKPKAQHVRDLDSRQQQKHSRRAAAPAAAAQAKTRTSHRPPGEASFRKRVFRFPRNAFLRHKRKHQPRKIRSTAPCRGKTGGTRATDAAALTASRDIRRKSAEPSAILVSPSRLMVQ